MDRDKIKGKMEDIKGRVKRQAGEWTGDQKLQDEGTGDQIKGKAQNAWGNVKEGARNMADDAREGVNRMKRDAKREDRNLDRDIDRKRDAA
jgi:uncharacterized protein YjbJ (UPF0337 family)